MGRAPCCDKANVKKGPWSPEEDAKLKAYIEQYGTGGNWIALPQKIGLKRCGKSCRLRWLNYLRPNIKHGGFSEEEDNIICSLYISIGSRWSIIAAQLPGRTDNDIKNYWNTKLKKKLLGRRKPSRSNQDPISDHIHQATTGSDDDNNNNQFSQGLSNSALERLQLHMQLQNIDSPFSLYNNPALWPKNIHPLQRKMIQSMQQQQQQQASNGNPNLLMPNPQPASTQPSEEVDNYLDGSVPFENLMDSTIVPKANGNDAYVQSFSNFQGELDGFLDHNKYQEDYNMNGSKESLIWWPTDDHFEAKSASSSSWGSTSVSVLQSNGIFQDYELGYPM